MDVAKKPRMSGNEFIKKALGGERNYKNIVLKKDLI